LSKGLWEMKKKGRKLGGKFKVNFQTPIKCQTIRIMLKSKMQIWIKIQDNNQDIEDKAWLVDKVK